MRILDQSAGGYTLVCDEQPKMKIGQTVVLTTTSGSCDAKVAHVTKHEDEVRIGLQRLGETRSAASRMISEFVDTATLVRLAVVLLLCVAFFAWGMKFAPTTNGMDAAAAAKEAQAKIEEQQKAQDQELAIKVLEMGSLHEATLSSDLDLSEQQRQQVQGIVRQATAALSSLYSKRESMSPEDWSTYGLQIMQTASSEIRSIMTAEQQGRWLQILQMQAAQIADVAN